MASMIVLSYDGDNAGRLCGRAVLSDDIKALHEVSARIRIGHEIVQQWVEQHGGKFISGGGDEGVFMLPEEAIKDIEELRKDYEYATNLTTTIGIGQTLSESGKALLVGKFRGKNTVVQYDSSIEDEIRQAKQHLQEGTASSEEKKLGEAYLQTPEPNTVTTMAQETKSEDQSKSNLKDDADCAYCRAMQEEQVEDPSHCRYCHDMGKDKEENSCKYCQQADENSPDSEDGLISPSNPDVKNPTTTDSEDFEGQGLNPPDLPKPPPIQEVPESVANMFEPESIENTRLATVGPTGKGVKEMVNGKIISSKDNRNKLEDVTSGDTVEDIANQIEELPADANEHMSDDLKNLDDTNLATGDDMEDGTSRPEDFAEEDSPKDMGLSEENEENEEMPDITSVMEEGLDSHAENIQKEKAINLAAEALEGFKSCKDILEKAKEQAPQLYESSIAMLKAMIEMAKLLGFNEIEDQNDITNSTPSDSAPAEGANGEHPGKAHTAENAFPQAAPLAEKPTGAQEKNPGKKK